MSTDAHAQKPLVLLVDDFSDTRMMYAEFLELSGFRVVEAADGLDAVEKAVALVPDIVVMDLSLPGLDGWEATRRIKQDARTTSIPVIAVSGFSGAPAEEARAAGAVACLTKPVLPDDLALAISGALAAAGAPRGGSDAGGGPA